MAAILKWFYCYVIILSVDHPILMKFDMQMQIVIWQKSKFLQILSRTLILHNEKNEIVLFSLYIKNVNKGGGYDHELFRAISSPVEITQAR